MALSGETPDFYAGERVSFLSACLRELGHRPRAVLDYGCGMGATAIHLARQLAPATLVGVDESGESVKRAACDFGSIARFLPLQDLPPEPVFDLVYCSGVFHHVQPDLRRAALAYLDARMRPGAIFALWENNPWNPAITITMNRSPIDRNAVKVTPPSARRLLRSGGFELLRTDFLFYFPRPLAPLRVLEPALRKLPLERSSRFSAARRPEPARSGLLQHVGVAEAEGRAVSPPAGGGGSGRRSAPTSRDRCRC
jgi:SAM-dependent methyltransferase